MSEWIESNLGEPPRAVQARVSPDGFVAQRMPCNFNGHGHWLLTYLIDAGPTVSVHTDAEVECWPQLYSAAQYPYKKSTDARVQSSAADDTTGAPDA